VKVLPRGWMGRNTSPSGEMARTSRMSSGRAGTVISEYFWRPCSFRIFQTLCVIVVREPSS